MRYAVTLAAVFGFLLCITVELVYRFQHPELTETQLFLRYWQWYVGAIVCAVLLKVAPE